MVYVLAIDGGGTKTKGVVAGRDGVIIASATVGASNPNSVSTVELKSELSRLIESLKVQAGPNFSKVRRLFAGMSGVEHPATKDDMVRLLRALAPDGVQVSLDNDAITALYSGTFGEPGIVQIAGTGSITYGLNRQGVRARAGGWGYLFSDHGSGYQIGRDGLEAAFLAHDGVGDPTSIESLLLERFDVDELPEIIRTVYHHANPKEIIASLSKLVVAAADDGDQVARHILSQNGERLGRSISCLAERLFSEDERSGTLPVVLAGGLFQRLDLFEKEIMQVLCEHDIDARLILPRIEPVGGALIAGLKEEKVSISEGLVEPFIHHFNQTLGG